MYEADSSQSDNKAQLEKTLTQVNNAIAAGAHLDVLFLSRACVKYRNSEYKECVEDCNKAIQQGAQNGDVHRLKGEALFVLKEFHEAVIAYTESIRLEPEYPYDRYSRAQAYQQLGSEASAIDDLEFLLQKIPNYDPAVSLLKELKGLQH